MNGAVAGALHGFTIMRELGGIRKLPVYNKIGHFLAARMRCKFVDRVTAIAKPADLFIRQADTRLIDDYAIQAARDENIRHDVQVL